MLAKLLHQGEGFPVDDGRMRILEDLPFLRRALDFLLRSDVPRYALLPSFCHLHSLVGYSGAMPLKGSARRKTADPDCGGHNPMLAIPVDSTLCF